MNLRIVLPLPYPPDVVMRALTTTAFHLDKIKSLGAFSCDLLEEGTKAGTHFVYIRRRMPNRPAVSGALAKFLPAEVVLEHRDEWDAVKRAGAIDIKVVGSPVRMQAHVAVRATAQGSEQIFDWDIKASVPLVGGALEKFVAKDLERSIHEESSIVRELLAQYV